MSILTQTFTAEEFKALGSCWPLEDLQAAITEPMTILQIMEKSISLDCPVTDSLACACFPSLWTEQEYRLLAIRFCEAVIPTAEPVPTVLSALREYTTGSVSEATLCAALDYFRNAAVTLTYEDAKCMPLHDLIWWASQELTARRPWALAVALAFQPIDEVMKVALKLCPVEQRSVFLSITLSILRGEV